MKIDMQEKRVLMHWYAGLVLAALPEQLHKYDMARMAADHAEALFDEVERRTRATGKEGQG